MTHTPFRAFRSVPRLPRSGILPLRSVAAAIQILALAIVLTRFDAAQIRHHTRVEWTTAQEPDTVQFRLYQVQSDGGLNFLDTWPACRTPGPCSYGWTGPFTPAATYLLEDLDIHGTVTPHGPIPVLSLAAP